MRKQRHKLPKASPRIIDKLMLVLSASARHVDGIWIGSYRTSENLTRVEHALLLVKQHSPLHYSRITSELERVWISLIPDGLAQYNRSLKACVLDERFVADSATTIERIASAIVHEATHARIERCGIGYDEDQRTRIEAICFRRELALAVRLPDSAALQQHIAEYLDWYPANPDYFRDAHFREREGNGEIVILRQIGAPDWLIRAHPTLKSIIGWARRLFRIVWARGQ
ncbi:MAG: hypothetical protein M3O26_21620 [Pseudomonadota bacterium]|jgi:hypothetical protein|nr:hypothetical protein [Pseudomonadota bacterium]